MVASSTKILFTLATLASSVAAQTFRRTATCPNLGCVFPPDQTEFIAGQVYDLRIEIQAPLNGTQSYNNGVPSEDFELTIGAKGAEQQAFTEFYGIEEPAFIKYNFTYFEDLFHEDNKSASFVNVVSKSYRHLTLYNPGEYVVTLTYNGGMKTVANWIVLPLAESKKAKNAILFIGDGMSSSMVTAARLLGHRTVNGKYQTTLAMDGAPGFGMQSTHSIDSFITDSANSATALTAGKKSTVNALNVYTTSSPVHSENPRFETIFEMGQRIYGNAIGVVTTAYLADATPASTNAHTSLRSKYAYIIDSFLAGESLYPWTKWAGFQVVFGGGGNDFVPSDNNKNVSQVDKWVKAGYEFVDSKTSLNALGSDKKALGVFSSDTMATWLDRNVYPENLEAFESWNGTKGAAVDQPGLKEMTLKALEILKAKADADGTGFQLMSEAASIDKQMHIADYDRALGELLEFDDTIRATLAWLKENNLDEETLVVVTADHGHGFDVFGSVDTSYLKAQTTNDTKRNAVGTYLKSGLSAYQVAVGVNPQNTTNVVGKQGEGFPVNWAPRYTAAMGLVADLDLYESYQVHSNGSRITSVEDEETGRQNANPEDGVGGFFVSGNLPTTDSSGVHSLTDVPVYAWGPGHELFRGHLNSPEIGLRIAQALDLGKETNVTVY